jgi:hypothetical protein
VEDWRRFEQQYASAQDAFQRGDAEPIKALWSHADDVTLFGALGGHERGWAAIGSRLLQVARMNTSGAHISSTCSTRHRVSWSYWTRRRT